MIIWAYLEPCDVKRYPEITKFQAMTLGDLQPMSKLSPWQWMETMLRGCDMIDDFLKVLERLAQQTYLSLPDCRTKSEEIELVRG